MAKRKKASTPSKKGKRKTGLKDLDSRGKVKGGFNPQPEPPRNRGPIAPISNPSYKGGIAAKGISG
jgi:hypothetical protein